MSRHVILPALAQRVRGDRRLRYLTLTATTTGAATVTINRLTLSVPTVISWGDGTTTAHSAGTTTEVTHNYAGAGTWAIRVPRAEAITYLNLQDAKLGGLDTAQLRGNAITGFLVTAITGSTIRSSDMTAWQPTLFRLYSMPAGTYDINSAHMTSWPCGSFWLNMPAGTYSIDSAHMAAWPCTSWRLYSMPAGTYSINSAHMASWPCTSWWLTDMPAGTYTINTAHMAAWNPSNWRLKAMPAGTYSFAASCMRGWPATNEILVYDLGLLQATVDAILYDVWAGFAAKTVTGGILSIGGTNAAPLGTFQAASTCPVTAATPGKEIAWELLNDTCNVSTKHWATVTISS